VSLKINLLLKQWRNLVLAGLLVMTSHAIAEPMDVEFVDMEGNSVLLSDFRGQWVVVNLWATWCPPCIKEMPDLTLFHDKHKDTKAIVLGVNYENIPIERINTFTEELMITFPVVRFKEIDLNANHTPFGPLRGLPSTYMVAPSGHIVAGRAGLVDSELLENFIAEFERRNP